MEVKKTCTSCNASFVIGRDEIALLGKLSPRIAGTAYSIPAPSHCPACREQRRLSWRNERLYYRRKCDLTGSGIVSIYSPQGPTVVYQHKAWYSDSWDALSYGRDFDFSQPFFPQFAALHRQVPLINLDVKADNENCDYTHLIAESRNCYQVVACSAGEDCMYSAFIQRNRSAVDCFFVFDSELCYECIDCYRCYDLIHSQYCQSCIESAYLYNCRGLSNCFGCVSLVNKKHHVFNKPVSQEQYKALLSRYLKDGEITAEAKQEINRLRKSCPQKAYSGLQNEDISGDHISYSKNSHYCFDCTYLEDCRYCTWFHKSKDCMDCYGWGLGGELGYENHLVGNTFQRVLFCDSCWEGVSDLLYCRLCVNRCSNLFGCVGLRGKEYCILNKQFRKDDYQQLLPRIIEHLRATGEWGEFFSQQISPLAYNETVACEYYPLSREEALQRNLTWQEQLPHTQGKETIPLGAPLPPIREASEQITKEVLACENCRKNYRVIAQELRFYKKMGLALPRLCFNCRHLARRERRNKRMLHWRNCDKCGKKITSSFSPQQPEPVYCEECYQVAVQ